MFMKDDKRKKAATIIISKMKGPESVKEIPQMEEPEMDSMDVAIEEIIMAVEQKDKGMLKQALLSFIQMADELEED